MLTLNIVYADVVAPPPLFFGGLIMLFVLAIPVAVIAVLAFLIILWIRKKHHPKNESE